MSKIIGGSAFGQGDALIDTSGAVLLDGQTVVVMGAINKAGVDTVLGLELEGRINKSTERSNVLYLMDADGAAAIITELLGLAGRVSPEFLDLMLARIDRLPSSG